MVLYFFVDKDVVEYVIIVFKKVIMIGVLNFVGKKCFVVMNVMVIFVKVVKFVEGNVKYFVIINVVKKIVLKFVIFV